MPYNPGISYRGDEYLFRGIESLGANISKVIDRKKAEGQEAANLRKLGGIYAPEMKAELQTKSLKELRALGAAWAAQQQMQAQQSAMNLQSAQANNLTADNERANQFLQLQRAQDQRAAGRASGMEALARDYVEMEVPAFLRSPDVVAAFPGIVERAGSPLERLRYAMGRNPNGVTPEMLNILTRYVTEQVRPNVNQKSPPEVVQLDVNGRKVPVIWNKDTGATIVAPGEAKSKTPEVRPAVDASSGKPIPGWFVDADGRIHKKASNMASAVGDLLADAAGDEAGNPEPANLKSGKVREIGSKEEYDKLPSGSIYIGKDGRQFKKP